MCYYPYLVSVLFTGPSLLVLNFYGKVFSPSLCSFLAAWQETHEEVQLYVIHVVILIIVQTIYRKNTAMCSVASQLCLMQTTHHWQ